MAEKDKKKTTRKKSMKTRKTEKKHEETIETIQERWVELKENELVIKFDNRHQILPRLIELARHSSESHLSFLTQPGVTEDVLGGTRARIIVSTCAGSTAWTATLGDLGLNPLIFRSCVAAGVDQAGYVPPANIPASPATRLIDVVFAIQGAPHK